MRTRIAGLLAALIALLASGALLAQNLAITKLEHYTENRGWNEAGVSPTWQTVILATVVPSGVPTLVFAEQGGVRQPLVHVAGASAPDMYAFWQGFQPATAGAWRIVAERGEAKSAPAWTRAPVRPRQVPLARNVRVAGAGTQPRVSWELPDLAGYDIGRIRVAVRGGARLHGRFLDVLYTSGALPAAATAFTMRAGVLEPGERYIFQVMLEELEGGDIRNRSSAFSDPHLVPR